MKNKLEIIWLSFVLTLFSIFSVYSQDLKKEYNNRNFDSLKLYSPRIVERNLNQVSIINNLKWKSQIQITPSFGMRNQIQMIGGNNTFNSGVLVLKDGIDVSIPGLGCSQFDLLNLNSLDLDTFFSENGNNTSEYGFNSTAGYLNFKTKSPIDFPGMSIELIGGNLSTLGGAYRNAIVSKKGNLGFKLNLQYFKGNDFSLSKNSNQNALFQKQIISSIIGSDGFMTPDQTNAKVLMNLNQIDSDGNGQLISKDWENYSIGSGLEFRPRKQTELLFTNSFSFAKSVFYDYFGEGFDQSNQFFSDFRLKNNGLNFDVNFTKNNGGDINKPSFHYQTGNIWPLSFSSLKSKLFYDLSIKNFFNSFFTVGIESKNTYYNTKNQITGRNENIDDLSIIGVFEKSVFEFGKKTSLNLDSRIEKANWFKKIFFEPRLSLNFKPNPKNHLEIGYNRGYKLPTVIDMYGDFRVSNVSQNSDSWFLGGKNGFDFGNNPLINFTYSGMPNVPANLNSLPLSAAFEVMKSSIYKEILKSPNLASYVAEDIVRLISTTADFSNLSSGKLTYSDKNFNGFAPLKPEMFQSLDFGYRFKPSSKLTILVDIFGTNVKNVNKFLNISSNVIYSDNTISNDLKIYLDGLVYEYMRKALQMYGGEGQYAARMITNYTTEIAFNTSEKFVNEMGPYFKNFGKVEPSNAPGDGLSHSIFGVVNIGNIRYFGANISTDFALNNKTDLVANYSWLNKNDFSGGGIINGYNYSLNIPKNKFRLGIDVHPKFGFGGNLLYQYNGAFNADLGQYSGEVRSASLIDGNVNYKFKSGFEFVLSGSNLLNKKYIQYNNMPEIGRRIIAKIIYKL